MSSELSHFPCVLQLQPMATLLPIEAWQEKGLVANASVSFLRPFQRLSWDISSKTNRVFGHIATDLITDCVYTELACLDSHSGSLATEMVHTSAVFGGNDVLSVVFKFTSLFFFCCPCPLPVPFSLYPLTSFLC